MKRLLIFLGLFLRIVSHGQSPEAPVAVDPASNITADGFKMEWAPSATANHYQVDVATDPGFTSMLPNWTDENVGHHHSANMNSGTGGTIYYYRVRAVNDDGVSPNSNVVSVQTIPSNPTMLITGTSQNSITIRLSSEGAADYSLDVSTASDFSSFVSPYQNFLTGPPTGNPFDYNITGLQAGTTYYMRVWSKNSGGALSDRDRKDSQTTIPPDPTASDATSVTQTSFAANWEASAAALSYKLDVSTSSTFDTFVAGYDDKGVSGPTHTVHSGIVAGTTYYYRLRATGVGGTSGNSNQITITTVPPDPLATPASSVTPVSFVANWNAADGATGYFLDVSADNFSTFVSGYNNLSVTGTSQDVTGLSPFTTYKYRVRAVNGSGTSGNSNTISQITSQTPLPGTVVATGATNPGQTGFTANWGSVVGATSYQLDVSADNFISFESGYNSKSVTGTSDDVAGLTPGITYQYRVRAVNVGGASPNSNIIAQLLIPATPTASAASNIQTNDFFATWLNVTGETEYELDVSTDNFATFVAGYQAKAIAANTIQSQVIGLTASTAYRYRLRSKNSTGLSPNSNVIFVITETSTGSAGLSITTAPISIAQVAGFGQTAQTVNVVGGVGTVKVVMKHRQITNSTSGFTSMTTVDKGSGNFEATILESLLDELGLEFYFEATDHAGTTAVSSGHSFIYKLIGGTVSTIIPFMSDFDGTAATYEMFSVPYVLTEKNISDIFDELGAPDKAKWRIFHYQSGNYLEYPDNLTSIELGKAYWFNTRQKSEIRLGVGAITQANQSTPFTIALEKGWNQIGNPFPFSINWTQIKALGSNSHAGLNSLWTFADRTYVNTTEFKPWTGAFVFSDNGGTITIPVTAKCSGCRTSASMSSKNIDEDQWLLPIRLNLNGTEQVSGFGMSPEANTSKDEFDEITKPRFLDYLEMDTQHPEFFAPKFATDVVPTTDHQSWLFSISSNRGIGPASITWEQSAIANSEAKLLLLDMQEQLLVDMKAANTYSFNWSDGKQFRIIYSKTGEILPGVTLMGHAYPNPFRTVATIPVMLEKDQNTIRVYVFDVLGRKVRTITMESVQAGLHNISWDGLTDQGSVTESGLYLYQLYGDTGSLSPPKRLIKQ